MKPTPLQTHQDKTRNQCKIDRSPRRTWKPYKETASHCNYSWNKHWPKLNKMSRKTKTSPNDFPDHLEQLKLSKPWKLQLPSLDEPSQTQNMKSPNMPVETDTAGVLQLNIRCPSMICSSTTSRLNMIKTRFWGTKLQKWSDKTFTWHNGAMVFPRVHVNRVNFGSMLLCSRLMKNVSFATCILLARNKGPSINPSQMSGWSHHICLDTS